MLKGSFRDACNLYGFIKYNPARDLRLPTFDRIGEHVKHLYTQEEIDIILNRFKDNDTFTCVFLTACFTGMRTGEVCALTWDNIDLNNGIIKIVNNVYDKPKDTKGKWFLGTTKTLNDGVELRDVTDILGHKNVETTENFYISSTDDSRKYPTEVFDSIIKSDIINEIIKYEI